MSGLNQLLTLPSLKILNLIPALIGLMILFHLIYIAILLVTSVISVYHSRTRPGITELLMNSLAGRSLNFWIFIGFGLLPLFSITVLFQMLFINSGAGIHQFLAKLGLLLLFGYLLLFIFRKIKLLASGIFACMMLLAYGYYLINVMSLIIFPEKWLFIKTILPHPLFSITPVVQFAIFITTGFIITGSFLLVWFFKWAEIKLSPADPAYDQIRYHGYGLMLAGTLLTPPLLLLDLATLPDYSLSNPVFIISAGLLLVLALLAVPAANLVKKRKQDLPVKWNLQFLVLILCVLFVARFWLLVNSSNLETLALVKSDAEKVQSETINQRQEIYEKNMIVDEKEGEKIYQEQCTSCHDFDRKVLGPPLNKVLPKYKDRGAQLELFLKKPTKIDASYPAMPDPGLSTLKIKAVVKFLLGMPGQITSNKPQKHGKE